MANLPEPSRKRLLSLLLLLRQQEEAFSDKTGGSPAITSRTIARLTGWTDATIRRDISQLGLRCGAAKGYPIGELGEAIEQALGSAPETRHRCCILGLGKIGAALLDDSQLSGAGFQMVAGFDESVNRVELLEASFPLYPASRLEQVIRQESIEFALLTGPDQTAVAYGQRLVAAGIRGIVNYTNVLLTVPPQVQVENVSAIHSLRQLAPGRLLQHK